MCGVCGCVCEDESKAGGVASSQNLRHSLLYLYTHRWVRASLHFASQTQLASL